MPEIKNAFNSSKIAGNAYCKIPNQCSRNNDTLCAKCNADYELKDDGKCHRCRTGYSKTGINTNRCQANARCTSQQKFINGQCRLMCGLTSSVLKGKGVKQLTVKTNPVPSLNKITNYELENNSVDVSLEDNYFVNVASPGRIGCSNSNGRPNLLISGIGKCTKFAGCEIESTPLKCSRYIKLKSTSSIPTPSINDWVTAVNKHKSNPNKDYLELIGERYTQCAKPGTGYTLRDESKINPFSQPNYTIRR